MRSWVPMHDAYLCLEHDRNRFRDASARSIAWCLCQECINKGNQPKSKTGQFVANLMVGPYASFRIWLILVSLVFVAAPVQGIPVLDPGPGDRDLWDNLYEEATVPEVEITPALPSGHGVGDALIAVTADGKVAIGSLPFLNPKNPSTLDEGFVMDVIIFGLPHLTSGDRVYLAADSHVRGDVVLFEGQLYSEAVDSATTRFEAIPWELIGSDFQIIVPGVGVPAHLILGLLDRGLVHPCQAAQFVSSGSPSSDPSTCGLSIGGLGNIPDTLIGIVADPCLVFGPRSNVCDAEIRPCEFNVRAPGTCGEPLPGLDECDIMGFVPPLCSDPPPVPDPCSVGLDAPGTCGNPTPRADPCDYLHAAPGQCGNPLPNLDPCGGDWPKSSILCGDPINPTKLCYFIEDVPVLCEDLQDVYLLECLRGDTQHECAVGSLITKACYVANRQYSLCGPITELLHKYGDIVWECLQSYRDCLIRPDISCPENPMCIQASRYSRAGSSDANGRHFRECQYSLETAKRSDFGDITTDYLAAHVAELRQYYEVYGAEATAAYREYDSFCSPESGKTGHKGAYTTGWASVLLGPKTTRGYEWEGGQSKDFQVITAFHGSECTSSFGRGSVHQVNDFAKCSGKHLFSASPGFEMGFIPRDGQNNRLHFYGVNIFEVNDVPVHHETCLGGWPKGVYEAVKYAIATGKKLSKYDQKGYWGWQVGFEGLERLVEFHARERCVVNYEFEHKNDAVSSAAAFEAKPGYDGASSWSTQKESLAVISIYIQEGMIGTHRIGFNTIMHYDWAIGVSEDATDDYVAGSYWERFVQPQERNVFIW